MTGVRASPLSQPSPPCSASRSPLYRTSPSATLSACGGRGTEMQNESARQGGSMGGAHPAVSAGPLGCGLRYTQATGPAAGGHKAEGWRDAWFDVRRRCGRAEAGNPSWSGLQQACSGTGRSRRSLRSCRARLVTAPPTDKERHCEGCEEPTRKTMHTHVHGGIRTHGLRRREEASSPEKSTMQACSSRASSQKERDRGILYTNQIAAAGPCHRR